jgi:hypothetical protein
MSKRKDRNWTIAIRPSARTTPHKITKIIGLNGGGFSVLVPYHKAKSGFLYKLPVDPKTDLGPGERWVPYAECVGFTARDRVKLSYHTDGFAQFSGETPGKIISGRDPATGEPKGLGLFTRPLTSPIRTGPSVGVTIFGIDDFEAVTGRDDPLIFEPSDFYYRGTTPEEANAWILSIYAFPIGVTPPRPLQQRQCRARGGAGGIKPALGFGSGAKGRSPSGGKCLSRSPPQSLQGERRPEVRLVDQRTGRLDYATKGACVDGVVSCNENPSGRTRFPRPWDEASGQ